MRAAAQQTAHRHSRERRSRPEWAVVAFVSLVAATAYLCLSISQAIGSHYSEETSPAIAALAPRDEADSEQVPAPPTVEASAAELAAPAPRPIRGLAPAVGDPALLAVIQGAIGQDSDHIAVSVRRISDGRSAAVNGDYQFYAASTFKLAVLYEAELRHFLGELEYSDRLFITDEDAAEDLGTSGRLEFEPDGSITIGHLLEAMITVSDNSSAVTLMHAFGAGNIDQTLRLLGLSTMTVNQVELWTTADDLARLMQAIYVGEGLGIRERAHMRDLLLAQTIRNGIPGALLGEVDSGLLIGNKTGTWPGAQHDVAFVEAQSGAYVIAILTDGSYEGWLALHRVVPEVHAALSD